MNILIDRILELSGPLPNPAAHRRHLEGLNGRALQDRLNALEAEALKPPTVARRLVFTARALSSERLEVNRG